MNHPQVLGFGSNLIVDGKSQSPHKLAQVDVVRDAISFTAQAIDQEQETDSSSLVIIENLLDDSQGITAGLVLSESHVVAHFFPTKATVTLIIFSRRFMDWKFVTRGFFSKLDVSNLESHYNGRSCLIFQKDVVKKLRSSRLYTLARLGY